ncbi:MAG: V-type ATP synthase subunit A, partial [Methanopyri archaeon]|nr:V-type ATP synthase subunit A [Methanopyri archaeon]
MSNNGTVKGEIVKVAGPVVEAEGCEGAKMYEVFRVGDEGLIGEVINIEEDRATIQVYEETTGLQPGEPVEGTGELLSVELGPGLLSQIFDGIQRPLPEIREEVGDFVERGILVPALDRDKKWEFKPVVNEGTKVEEGDVLGTVPETEVIEHKIMVPPGVSGTVIDIASDGEYTIEETIAVIEDEEGEEHEIKMYQEWPVRRPRPYKRKLDPEEPLITGQRVIDTFFPVAKGGTAAIPGPFGSGKTVTQQQLAKWSDAQVVVYIG